VIDQNPTSAAAKARARRWAILLRRFPEFADMRVLDLGGTPTSWETAPVMPARLQIVNLRPYDDERCVVGDACNPPPGSITGFDLVFSNSVIEHVGGYQRRRAMAAVVAGPAPHHWIQTPARTFPIEPHWLFPLFQFLPVRARVAVAQKWHHSAFADARDDRMKMTEAVLSIELIGMTEMRYLFSGSDIIRERFAGLTKSIIAVQ
jgi:hypothetical protein